MHKKFSRLIPAVACTATISFFSLCGSYGAAPPPTTEPAPTTAPSSLQAIAWDQAAKHVGETATVTGPVMGVHAFAGGKRVVLNVGKDFPDASRFTVLLTLGGGGPGKAAHRSPGTSAPTTVPTSLPGGNSTGGNSTGGDSAGGESTGASSPSVEDTYVGKTISVTGKIELYHDVTEVRATASDIVFQN